MSFSERLQKVMDEKGYTKYKVGKILTYVCDNDFQLLKEQNKARHHKVRSDESFVGGKSKMAFNR